LPRCADQEQKRVAVVRLDLLAGFCRRVPGTWRAFDRSEPRIAACEGFNRAESLDSLSQDLPDRGRARGLSDPARIAPVAGDGDRETLAP
jgi:hypothetical protein